MKTERGEKIMEVDDFRNIGQLESIAWHTEENADGDAYYKPSRTTVRFTGNTGGFYDVVLHPQPWMDQEEEIHELNVILNYYDLLVGGKIIGINWTVNEAVNYSRRNLQYHYKGKFCINADEFLVKWGWDAPEYCF
jgi:hypothetical protein